MNTRHPARKLSVIRNTNTPRATMESNAKNGLCAISLVASAAEIPVVIDEALPEGKYCFVKDCLHAIDKTAETLIGLRPREGKTFVMIERRAAMDLILTLVLGETKTGGILDGEFDPINEIRASHAELVTAAAQVKTLLTAASATEMSIEEFRAGIERTGNPSLAKQLLDVMSTQAPTVRSSAGLVPLTLDKISIKDLPSDRIHELDVTVTLGFNDQSNSACVMVRTLLDADQSIFSPGITFRILCLDAEQRLSLLLAQAARKPVRIRVSLPRVAIVACVRTDFMATLENVTMLECEDAEQLKGMLVKQLKLVL
jgi:hypothetical protein